ncbi:hypothetical protein JCM11251_007648 [Rhodosporidiobolus azoricus]
MFSSWFFSYSASPDVGAAKEPLTPLPPKLHLRSPSVASAIHQSPPSSPSLPLGERPEDAGGQSSRFGGHSFAELLLSRNLRESVLLHEGAECHGDGTEGTGRENSMLVLPGGEFAVVGPEAHLLLQELHRLRISVAQKTRRRTAYHAGALSLVVLGVTVWFLVETRRISNLSLLGLLSASLIAFLHFSLAFTNMVLAFVWKTELSTRCEWGIGSAWTLSDKGDACPEGKRVGWKGWAVAAGVRLVVTTPFLAIWLFFLRRYNLALHTPYRISPSALPSSELRSLLERHRADIVPLSSTAHAGHAHHLPHGTDAGGNDALPAMPDRAAHYALVSEGEESMMWSYRGSEVSRVTSHAAGGGAGGKPGGGVGGWVGAKVWGGMGWLFGVQPYPQAVEDKEKLAAEGGDQEKQGLGRRQLDEEEEASFVGETRPAPSILSGHSNALSWLSPEQHEDAASSASDYRSLFTGLRRPPSSSSFSFTSSSNKRHSNGTVISSAPLLDRPLPPPGEGDEILEAGADLPPPPPPPKDLHHASHGSSGSSQGAIVYVRMSDGRLVRRLSTIASVSEAGFSSSSPSLGQSSSERHHYFGLSRSDLTGSGSHSGSGRSGSESFATAAEVFAFHGEQEQEVLIVEDGTGEVVEEWRQRNE